MKLKVISFILLSILICSLVFFSLIPIKKNGDIDDWRVNYTIPPVLNGTMCTTKLYGNYYYPVEGVCKLNCDIEQTAIYKDIRSGECKPKPSLVNFNGTHIIAKEDIKLALENTYFYHKFATILRPITVELGRGESYPMKYEYITVESLINPNKTNIHIKFIPTKLFNVLRKPKQYNVNLYLLDGISRQEFDRQMMNVVSYLNSIKDDFHLIQLFRYHTLGLNSNPNYLPIFFGKTFEESQNDTKGEFKKLCNVLDYVNDNYKTVYLSEFCEGNLNFHHRGIRLDGLDHEFQLGCLPNMK